VTALTFTSSWPAIVAVAAFLAIAAAPAMAADANIPHLARQGNVTQLIVEGKPFIMLGGELHNSSASSLEYMEPIWPRLAALNFNTVIASVSWELVEPVEGKFDFKLVDGLVQAARKNNLRLVFLWFASWKNGVSTYVPAWVKTDLQRFPRAKNKSGGSFEVITPLSDANLAADAKAYAALMKHIREIDQKQQTVITMQVENEVGLLGDSRDRSPQADAAFAKPIPAELTEYLQKHKDTLIPELKAMIDAAGGKTAGTWTEVFGKDADETFMAWHYAKYVGAVVAAGKAEHPIPMYANAWQEQGQKAGQYPSGGPLAKYIDIYRAAGPQIDFVAPDIYVPDFHGVSAAYARGGNPLFIPETGPDASAPKKALMTVIEFNGLGFCPFGIDALPADHPLGPTYKLLGDLMPAITANQGTPGRIVLVRQDATGSATPRVDVGDYRVNIRFTAPRPAGADSVSPSPTSQGGSNWAIVIASGPDEYIIAGTGVDVRFSNPKTPGPRGVSFIAVDEGRFKDGRWVAGRRLNGDETGASERVSLRAGPLTIQKVKLYRRD
jgi:hypothetical protein